MWAFHREDNPDGWQSIQPDTQDLGICNYLEQRLRSSLHHEAESARLLANVTLPGEHSCIEAVGGRPLSDRAGVHRGDSAVLGGEGAWLTGVSASDRRAKASHQIVMNIAPPRNLAVAPLGPLFVVEQRQDRAPRRWCGAGRAPGCADAEQHGVAAGALANVGKDLRCAGLR
jgi:hypothetical protein